MISIFEIQKGFKHFFSINCIYIISLIANADEVESRAPTFVFFPKCCVTQEFSTADSAFAAMKQVWDYRSVLPWGVVVTRTAMNLKPWSGYPIYNGIASYYVSDYRWCDDDQCSDHFNAGPSVESSMRCDNGFTLVIKGNGSSLSKEAVCERPIAYVAVIPHNVPPMLCEATVGNPIDTSNGAKIQKEVDIEAGGVGQVGFERTYRHTNKNSSGKWILNYQKTLNVFEDELRGGVREKSLPYTSKSTACTSGWTNIQPKLSDAWAQGAAASWNAEVDRCEIKKNNLVVTELPILPDPPILRLHIPGYVQLIREDGSRLNFHKTKDAGVFVNREGQGGIVKRILAPEQYWEFTDVSGAIETYDAKGKLIALVASNGMKQELVYDATSGLLSSVKDSTGRTLVFSYANDQISSITVDGTKTTSYAYNSEGLISKVTRPDFTARIYHYEDSRFPTALTGITDERGKRYATWKYDDAGRAISSEHAGGAEKTLLSFNADGSTTVTNALNKKTTYHFADIAGARRVVKVEGHPTTNCAGANQDYSYTSTGWIASKTDWKGIKTTYQYNALGQETSRTEAFGTTEARTITTEWHPTLYLKSKIIEPDKETTFTYDVNGRLLNQSVRSLIN
jgi:YD repeat-containing protein